MGDEGVMKVDLGGKSYELRPPQSVMLCIDIASAEVHNRVRAHAAALALCLPPSNPPITPKAGLVQHKYNVGTYGGECYDYFINKNGWSHAEVQSAGALAYVVCIKEAIGEPDVAASESFSEADAVESGA